VITDAQTGQILSLATSGDAIVRTSAQSFKVKASNGVRSVEMQLRKSLWQTGRSSRVLPGRGARRALSFTQPLVGGTMNLLRWLKSASAASMVVAIGACSSDPVSPVAWRLDAAYAATSVGGQPLPRTESYVDSYTTLIADTLYFSSDGTIKRTTVFESTDGSTNPQPLHFNVSGLWRYVIDGTRLKLSVVCPINANCIGPTEGKIFESRVTLRPGPLTDTAGTWSTPGYIS
jgi:hypothetical protein